ncbi:hypothetical protein GRAQ_02699 [Rahnella aquatilis CIP 78.65 = ATCC 33071]|uniref:O-Antigen ligase n=1 Tax=Rahnella aquatilis (strain ATCC 33071 / DSM 4594 / JCM 1683 / NBRC 105701 / NCIMB 13365 / CIP 78.65) TaxID=745277 RepID=H2IPG4_RAHAC|nr:hypothetical protein [Rahnella aquatilis]AEX53472.1 hypothetical protein Rahaq2_3684 [Rahnella aquatilis CIP 78.65 = ATCC 33071]KFD03380.1 hypothetical protein GRAQ_02699 [Rahnella aquatilis CIP 78.65 = ATCC 33071]
MIKLVYFYLFTVFYYNFYRYIFRINNARTSPTYSDTPLWLSSGKYIIIFATFGLMIFVLAMYKYKVKPYGVSVAVRQDRKNDSIYIILSMLFCLYAMSVTVLSRDAYAFESVCFFPVFIFMLIGQYDREKLFNKIYNIVKVSAWIFLFYDLIQYLLFYFFNRLPALAYAGSVSVRFGSLQDDPNGYAFLLAALYFVGMSYYGYKKTIFYLLYAINLLLTISFTGMASVMLSIVVVMTLSMPVSFTKLVTAWFSLVFGVIGIMLLSQLPILQNILSTKQGSIDQHANLFSALSNIGIPDVLGFNPPGWIAESAYVNILLNFGIIVTLAMYGMVITILYRFSQHLKSYKKHFRYIKNDPTYILGLCALTFCLAVFIGGINLPLEVVFPVNALFPFFLALLCLISKHNYFLQSER